MIKISFSLAVLLYLFPWLAILAFFWIRSETLRRFRKLPPLKELTFRCPVCTYVYLHPAHQEFSRCPRCGSINSRDLT